MRKILTGLLVVTAITSIAAQEIRQTELALTTVALFSSGVGFFEHAGTVRGETVISLSFDRVAVNDVLKSLVIHDPSSLAPTVGYPSEDTLEKTLKGLRIDLSGDPGLGDLLNGLRGAEIRLTVPNEVTGRILGVERRSDSRTGGKRDYLTVSVNGEYAFSGSTKFRGFHLPILAFQTIWPVRLISFFPLVTPRLDPFC